MHKQADNRICLETDIMGIVMTDPEFMDRAESLLRAIEACCDRINDSTDADVDNQRVGGMITLTFANHSQIIVNLQKPLHEVWMAARSGGYHYKFDSNEWRDTKGQGEFFANLSRYASEQAGLALQFTP
jgi:CyaY protein